jgi:hypothetical protein
MKRDEGRQKVGGGEKPNESRGIEILSVQFPLTSENVCEKIEMSRVYNMRTDMATNSTISGAPKSMDSSSACSNPKNADPKNTWSKSQAISP